MRIWVRGIAERSVFLALLGILLLGFGRIQARAQTAAQRAALARLNGVRSRAVSPSGTEATSIALDAPTGLAFDSAGNLYIADTDNNVVREVGVDGVVTTVAGNGLEGFAGDGGAAASAQLDTPTGIAVDSNGNLYIADSHNNRIRKVSGGLITTYAGTGTAGFSGDGGAATSAALATPIALCIDTNGNLYIADTGNNRIREVAAGTIHTVAGNGQQGFSGDGGAATAATLDTPAGVAVDSSLNVYIGDTHNQRVRMVSAASGIITTIAGTGTKGFTADGTELSSELASPSGLWVDQSGTVYVADADNDRIRTISGGNLKTIAGTGAEGFGGDAGASSSALLDTPRALTGFGTSIFFSDTLNNRVREITNGTIDTTGGQPSSSSESLAIGGATSAIYGTGSLTATFSNNGVTGTGLVTFYDGVGSNPVAVGSASLSSNNANVNTGLLAAGTHYIVASYAGDAKNAPIVSGVYVFVVAQASLTAIANSANMLYGQAIPTLSGTLNGVLSQDAGKVSAVFSTAATITSAPGTYPITIALSGPSASDYTVTLGSGSGSLIIAKAPTVTTLTASSTIISGSGMTLTATVASTTSGTPGGSVNFFNGTVQLNTTPIAVDAGLATFATTTLPASTLSLTAVYSGDADFLTSTSAAVTQVALASDFSIAASPAAQSVVPTQSVSYTLTLTPTNLTFVYPVTLTVSGLPAGVTATFTPSPTIAAGAGTSTVQMTVNATRLARLEPRRGTSSGTGSPFVLAVLFLPFALFRRFRKSGALLSLKGTLVVLLVSLVVSTTLVACGGGGFFGHSTQTYTVTVTAVSGSSTHSTNVILTVQ